MPLFILLIDLPDPDRITAATRVVLILWGVWLAVIYINGIPGGAGLISMAVPIGMILATTPQLSVTMLFTPIMNVFHTAWRYMSDLDIRMASRSLDRAPDVMAGLALSPMNPAAPER